MRILSVILAGRSSLFAALALLSCASSSRPPATAADGDEPRCAAGTRFERRVEGCVADAPDDEGPESWCTDEIPRPTREIMRDVQDMERQRGALAADDPSRPEVGRALVKGYEELGCATSREATDASAKIKALKGSDAEQVEKLQAEAERARRISKAAREAALKLRGELR